MNEEDGLIEFDGFEDCIVGIVERFGLSDYIVCYDKSKVLDRLCADMDEDEAIEYFYYNILGTYAGERTPCFLTNVEGLNDVASSEGSTES